MHFVPPSQPDEQTPRDVFHLRGTTGQRQYNGARFSTVQKSNASRRTVITKTRIKLSVKIIRRRYDATAKALNKRWNTSTDGWLDFCSSDN